SCSPTMVTARNSQSLLSETSAPAERAVAALLLELSVDIEVDLLGVEADKAGDSLALGQRSPIRPGDIVDDRLAEPERPVLGLSLVGAMAGGRAGRQELHMHVCLRDVVTGR